MAIMVGEANRWLNYGIKLSGNVLKNDYHYYINLNMKRCLLSMR